MELQKGRPGNINGRLTKEVRVYDLLDSIGIEYWHIDHEAVNTIEACAEIDKVLDAQICKNLFLCNRQQTEFYLLMIPGDKKLVTKELSKQIASPRLAFAKPEYMEKYLDILPGSVSVMGLMNDKENNVKLLVDEDIIKSEYAGCHPCVNTTSLKIRTDDLFGKVVPAMEHDMTVVKL